MVNYDLEIKNAWRKAQDLLGKSSKDEARDALDQCLLILSNVVLERNLRDNDKLGGVKMLVLYESVWVNLQKYDLMLS